MAIKIGINGFGRIGRMVLRSIIEQDRKDIKVVHINNKSSAEISRFLLANDTVHGKLKLKTELAGTDYSINFNRKVISYSRETEISKIGWQNYDVDVVLECTGKFNTIEKSSEHIKSGASSVFDNGKCVNGHKKL